MNKNEKLLEAINSNNPGYIEQMFRNQEIDINEYNAALKSLEEKEFIDLSFTPEQNREQYKRTKNYYNALIAFAIMDLIPMLWVAIFFVYIPVAVYIIVLVLGKTLLVPDERLLSEHNSLGLFMLLSLVPGLGIVADILIIVKALKLKESINQAEFNYNAAYQEQVRVNNLAN